MRARLPGQNNPYWTPKHDYRCAVEWCLRYPDWKKELSRLPEVNRGIDYSKDKVQSNSDYDATAELAIRRVEIEGKINLLENTAKLCMPQCTEYLIMGVTEDGVTYNTLKTRGMPYSQNGYFKIRQKFYHLIAKRI